MNINFLPYFVVWVALALVVIGLILYHRAVARQEDSLAGTGVFEAPDVARHQLVLEGKLGAIDKWGKTLTIITVVYGVILAALYLYQTWQQMSHVGV